MPLFEAITSQDLNFLRQYLLQGGDPNVRNENGSTPLHEAVYEGGPEMVSLLLEHQADVHLIDDYGNNAMHVAAMRGNLDEAKLLAALGAEIDAVNEKRTWSPLMIALNEQHAEMAQWLINQGASVNQVDQEQGWTPLLVACEQGLRDLTLELLRRGANPHVCLTGGDGRGKYAIHLSGYYGEVPIIRALVMSGVNIDLLPEEGGLAALHWAAYNHHHDLLLFLLQNGANVNIKATGIYQSRTPLHFAVAGRQEVMSLVLLDAGADPLAMDDEGKTPIDLAQNGKRDTLDPVYPRLIALLESYI